MVVLVVDILFTKLTASSDITPGDTNKICNQVYGGASGLGSCNSGPSWLDLRYAGASISMGGIMSGLLFHVWHMCVLEAVKRFLLFAGLVDVVTSGDVVIL